MCPSHLYLPFLITPGSNLNSSLSSAFFLFSVEVNPHIRLIMLLSDLSDFPLCSIFIDQIHTYKYQEYREFIPLLMHLLQDNL